MAVRPERRDGRFDVVADSIGGGGVQPMFDASLDEFEAAMRQKFTSVWSVMRHARRHMDHGASMVTISSAAAEGRGPGLPYSFGKVALEKLTSGAAGSLAARGIRVNCVRVGMIWGAFAARGMSEEQRILRASNVMLQTEGNNWDIARAAFFLLTDQARWITRQTITVDGGGFRMTGSSGAAGSAPSRTPGSPG